MKSMSDGITNTFLSGEMHIPKDKLNIPPYNGPAYNGLELVAHSRIGGPGVPLLATSDEPGEIFGFGSSHPGACNFVHVGGSTRTYQNFTDTIVLASLCHRSDGEIIELFD